MGVMKMDGLDKLIELQKDANQIAHLQLQVLRAFYVLFMVVAKRWITPIQWEQEHAFLWSIHNNVIACEPKKMKNGWDEM
jgi:hypothetical protein